MSRGLQSLVAVLVLAALLSGAMVGRYTALDDREPATAVRPPNDQSATASASASGPSHGTAEIAESDGPNRGGTMRGPQSSPRENESFSVWLERYLATNPDIGELRAQLETALAELPADPDAAAGDDATAAFDALQHTVQTAGDDYESLLEHTHRFLEAFPGSPRTAEVRAWSAKYAQAWDERDFEIARSFSRDYPDAFSARIDQYQSYLERHGASGRHMADARVAIETIRAAWADHEYQSIYDFAQRYPADRTVVANRLRRYLRDHAAGRRRAEAESYLAHWERATSSNEYRVRVVSGSFDRSVSRSLSRGPDLAVEIEVGGIRLGRTPIAPDTFNPVWNYEFPQSFRWRAGDSIRIRVIDFDYRNRTVLRIEPPAEEPVAIQFLTGTLDLGAHRLTLECNFEVPTLPPLSDDLSEQDNAT